MNSKGKKRVKLADVKWFKEQEGHQQLAVADTLYVESEDGFKGVASYQGNYWQDPVKQERYGAYLMDDKGKKHQTKFSKMSTCIQKEGLEYWEKVREWSPSPLAK